MMVMDKLGILFSLKSVFTLQLLLKYEFLNSKALFLAILFTKSLYMSFQI